MPLNHHSEQPGQQDSMMWLWLYIGYLGWWYIGIGLGWTDHNSLLRKVSLPVGPMHFQQIRCDGNLKGQGSYRYIMKAKKIWARTTQRRKKPFLLRKLPARTWVQGLDRVLEDICTRTFRRTSCRSCFSAFCISWVNCSLDCFRARDVLSNSWMRNASSLDWLGL